MTQKIKTPAYMTSFRCLGGDCMDTCCQHWDIRLDQYHYQKLETLLAEQPARADKFKQHIKLNSPPESSDRNFAYIALNEDGFCPFLKTDGLCDIHSNFGVDPLSDICAFFPRVFSSIDDELEMTGALSCPEVVRLCLAADDQNQKFTDYESKNLPRQDHIPVARRLAQDGTSFYHQAFNQVRAVMLSLATLDNFALETRLYFLANFAYRISGNYHQMSERQHKSLFEEIKRIQSNDVLQQLEDYYNRFDNVEPVAVVVIQAILQLRIQHAKDDKLSQLANSILTHYRRQLPINNEIDVYGENLPPVELWQAYQANWDKVNATVGVLFEKILSRYLINVLQREWYISMPDTFVYIQMLIIRIMMLRFLAVSHPNIINLLQSDLSVDETQKLFSDEMVKLIYQFARSIDHNHAFLTIVFQAMLEQQMLSFDYSLPFIKI